MLQDLLRQTVRDAATAWLPRIGQSSFRDRPMRPFVMFVLVEGLIIATFAATNALAAEPPTIEKKAAKKKTVGNAIVIAKANEVVPVAAPADSAVTDPAELEPSYESQLRPLMNGELHLVETVCALTPEQLAPVKQAADKCLGQLAVALVHLWRPRDFGNAAIWGGAAALNAARKSSRGLPEDPRTLIQDRLARKLKVVLEPGQSANYQSEINKRVAFRRRAQAVSLVAHMDRLLLLNPAQRERLADVLIGNWREDWNLPDGFLQSNSQQFPAIPHEWLTPLLTEKQLSIWFEVRKVGRLSSGMRRIELGITIEDVPWKPEIDRDASFPAGSASSKEPEAEANAP